MTRDAEQQGQPRAYICAAAEVADEGKLSIDRLREWDVPKTVVSDLRNTLGVKLTNTDLKIARSALRTVFDEYDSWAQYTDDYDEKMESFTRRLFAGVVVSLLLSFAAYQFPPTFAFGILFSGAAGSCVSIMAKMPVFEVGPSGELEAYRRRILSRIGLGVIGSLIGSGLLGWGILPIAIHGRTFGDVLNACTAYPGTHARFQTF